MPDVSEEHDEYPEIDLWKMEMETVAEGQEWMRRRMQDKLREAAAAFSPGSEQKAETRPAPEVAGKNPERRHHRGYRLRPGPA